MSSPIIFVSSQSDEDVQAPQRSAPFGSTFDIVYDRKGSPGRPKQATSSSKMSPWSSAQKAGPRTTPKARLRHEDSQIHFAAIDSSPLQPDELESQMLTDRQKEVRQRQLLEATTIFPDLGFLPKSTDHVSHESMPRLNFADNGKSSSPILSGDEATGSPAQYVLADFMGSSPTPRSRIERGRRWPIVQQPSLSPVVQVDSSFSICMPSGSDAPTEPHAEMTEKHGDVDLIHRDTPMSNDIDSSIFSEHGERTLDSLEARVDQPCTPRRNLVSVQEPVNGAVNSSPLSGVEVSIDARPESPRPSDDIARHHVSDVEHASNASSPVLGPFNEAIMGGDVQESATSMMHSETPELSQGPDIFAKAPHTPNEDEQIAAQLVHDLERASSQAENEMRENVTWSASPLVNAKKRKDVPGDSEADWKKQRARIEPPRKRQNIRVVVDSRRAPQAGADFVDIDVDDISPTPSQDASLKGIGSLAKGSKPGKAGKASKVTAKRTVGARSGAGRSARSSSISASTDWDSCGPSDATGLSAVDAKREEADHLPVGDRRRSTRLKGLPAGSQAFRGPDAAPMSSDEFGEFSGADSLEGIFVKVEQIREDGHSTPRQQTDDAHQALHGMGSSNGPTSSEAAPSRPETPAGTKGSADRPEMAEESGAQGILQSFRKLLENIKRVTLGIEEERAIVSVLVDSVREVHEAGRRHGKTAAPLDGIGSEAG